LPTTGLEAALWVPGSGAQGCPSLAAGWLQVAVVYGVDAFSPSSCRETLEEMEKRRTGIGTRSVVACGDFVESVSYRIPYRWGPDAVDYWEALFTSPS
jgi:hypothetical protein